jgi:hypothetical protein
MSDSEYNELREQSWRRKLTPEEERQAQAYWLTRPEAQVEWEEDLALTQQLRDVSEAPLSSNFTSLVLQAVEAETNAAHQRASRSFSTFWTGWLSRVAPKFALGLLVVGLGVGLFFRQHGHTRNKEVARDVNTFIVAANLPGPEVFEDFDAIRQLQPVSFSSTDDELLAALR